MADEGAVSILKDLAGESSLGVIYNAARFDPDVAEDGRLRFDRLKPASALNAVPDADVTTAEAALGATFPASARRRGALVRVCIRSGRSARLITSAKPGLPA